MILDFLGGDELPRFFKSMPVPPAVEELVEIDGQDAVHLRRSLRLTCGDAVLLCDGRSTEYDTVIDSFTDQSVWLRVTAVRESVAEPSLKVTLYQGLPKGDKLELIIQKAVELGVTAIVPVEMSRSIAKITDKAAKKQARWQTIADEAASQSGRGILPAVHSAIPFREALARMSGSPVIVCYEGGGQPLPSLIDASMRELSLVIGPEGGIAPEEIDALKTIGAEIATMGPRILRCETAPLAAIAVAMAQSGNWA